MAILFHTLLVLICFFLKINGYHYREFTEFDPGEILKYGVLDIYNRSDWLPVVQIENDVPRFKQFFLRLDYLDDLVPILLNYTALSLRESTVMPYYVHSEELQNPENVRILHEKTREARSEHLNFLSPAQVSPIFLNANSFLNDTFGKTVVPALRQLGLPFGIFISDMKTSSTLTITNQLFRILDDVIYIKAIIFYTVWPESNLIYDYANLVVYLNGIYQKINPVIPIISKNNHMMDNVDLTIYVHFQATSLRHMSLLTKFLYRWGEEVKCRVMAFWWNEIINTSEMDSYKNVLFKTFTPENTPRIGTIGYSQLGLLKEICRRKEKFSKFTDIEIEYTEPKQISKIIKSMKKLDCGVQISLEYNFYKDPDYNSLGEVLKIIETGNRKHSVIIKGITLSICNELCECYKEEGELRLRIAVYDTDGKNLTRAIKSCFPWLAMNDHFVKGEGIERLIYTPNFMFEKRQNVDVHLIEDKTKSLTRTAGIISSQYPWQTKNKDIFIDSSLKYYGLSKNVHCRSLKAHWNQLFNIATIQGFGVALPLTRLFRIEFGSTSTTMTNVTDHNHDHELMDGPSMTNIEKCLDLPSYGNNAFEFNTNFSGVTFHFEADRFSTTKMENLALLLEFISQTFKRIELVLEAIDMGSTRILLQSVHYLRRHIFSTHDKDSMNKCEFYFNFENRNISLDETKLLKEEFSGVVKGAHVNFHPKTETLVEKKNTLHLLQQTVEHVGIMIDYNDASVIAQNDFKKELAPSCNYVIVHVNIAKVISLQYKVPPIEVVQDFIEEKLNPATFYEIFLNLYSWKLLFKDMHRNVTLYARIAWPTTSDGRSTYAFLSVWKYVHLFSTKYELPVFVYQAFDHETESDMKYGWWKVRKMESGNNSTDLTDLENYFEKQADYLNLKTKRPKRKLHGSSSEESSIFSLTLANGIAISMAFAAVILLVVSTVAFCRIRVLKRVLILTEQEKQEFEMGILPSDENIDNENHIYGMRYDKDLYEIRRDDFVKESGTVIGKGQFGVVYKYFMPRFNNHVAVKLPNAKEKTQLMSILREIKLMAYLGEHMNVVKLQGAYTGEIQSGIVFVVTEYLENGSLLEYLRELGKSMDKDSPEPELLRELCGFCADISKGMGYLAEKNVIHGDLATRNVLLDGNNVCKISDFGLSKQLYAENIYVQTTSKPLPWAWLAVETLEQSVFTTKSDVWSMGVTFWEIFTLGNQPYPGLRWDIDFPRKLRDGLRLPKPEYILDEIYNEILKCWTIEPEDRPLPGFLANFFSRFKIETTS